jgi:nicotinamide mononucleotide (NMN) deamidase PncC
VLLRHSYANALAIGGVTVPPGVSPYKFVGSACGNHTPDCQKMIDAIKADSASAVRADATGRGTLPGVPPGTYYLMISTAYNQKSLIWGQAVQLKPGANSVTLDQSNATPLN